MCSPVFVSVVLAVYLSQRWWSVEDVVKTADPARDGLILVRMLFWTIAFTLELPSQSNYMELSLVCNSSCSEPVGSGLCGSPSASHLQDTVTCTLALSKQFCACNLWFICGIYFLLVFSLPSLPTKGIIINWITTLAIISHCLVGGVTTL